MTTFHRDLRPGAHGLRSPLITCLLVALVPSLVTGTAEGLGSEPERTGLICAPSPWEAASDIGSGEPTGFELVELSSGSVAGNDAVEIHQAFELTEESRTDQSTPPSGGAAATSPTADKPLTLDDLGFATNQVRGNAEAQARLDKRSHMLKIHQRLGLITLVPLLATIIASGGASGKQSSSSARAVHGALGIVTAGFYSASAYYAIAAPKVPGIEVRGPIRVHKVLAWIHGAGMILTPILGAMADAQRNRGERIHGVASAHSAVADVTIGAYAASAAALAIKF